MELKVAQIGNSRGVRLPASTLQRYCIGDVVLMEERVEGILLHPKSSKGNKLSWSETAQEMAADHENWSDWDYTTGDGIEKVAWKPGPGLVAEQRDSYGTKSNRHQKTRKGGS